MIAALRRNHSPENQSSPFHTDIHGGAGPISALFLNDRIEKPIPKATECLIKVKAFGLNRADTLQRMGGYPVPPGVTKIMGLEFAGLVEQVGDEAGEDFKLGDEVFGLAYGGGYAEYVAVNKKMLVKKPKELSWEECAGTPEVSSFLPVITLPCVDQLIVLRRSG